MRCRKCDYRLWNLPTRRCPECGTAFRPSDYEFVPNSVRFRCPHCSQDYYGTDPRGHLVPAAFSCVSCGRAIHMDDMILLPAEGVREEQTAPVCVPWLERHRRGFWRAWLQTIAMALVSPTQLMRALPPEKPGLGFALWTLTPACAIGMVFPCGFALLTPLLITRGRPTALVGLALSIPVAIVALTVLLLLASAVTHGMLKLLRAASEPLQRTSQAICYSAGAGVCMAFPCLGPYFGWIWWVVSAILMVREAHRTTGGKAAAAVLTLPVFSLGAIVGLWALFIYLMITRAGGLPTTLPAPPPPPLSPLPASAPESSPAASQKGPWIRVNQVGYRPGDPKIAVLSSDEPLKGSFQVGSLLAGIGPDGGAWGPFRHNYRLDFTALRKPGTYRIAVGPVRSPPFRIGDDVYRNLPDRLLAFMRLQRCGHNPVTGRKCHQQDGLDTETGRRVDLVGGWHDAADRLKHMITTTYCTAALFLAGATDEARHGAALVRKSHPAPDAIYVQVGDDRDHLPPESLWHEDRTDYGWGPGGPRAAWRATGRPQGPRYPNASTGLANLAGRAAAALALAGDLEASQSLYALARAHPGSTMSVPVRAPYWYAERDWLDDLEWAAAELFIATRDPQYLAQAIEYARRAGASPWMGLTHHEHYAFFPYVNLAHWRLHAHVDAATRNELAGFYRAGLERVRTLAGQNPYRLGTPLVWCSTNDVVAVATQAVLYEKMTGDTAYRTLAAEARDWIFGRNPWGVSFVIGVPSEGTAVRRPHHLFHKLAGILPAGGLVDGPVTPEINARFNFPDMGPDPYARFQSDVGVYHDCTADFSTNEPTIDGTVSLLLLISLW